jgi:hypothetical protein
MTERPFDKSSASSRVRDSGAAIAVDDAAICGFTEFRFHSAHDGDNAIGGTEMPEQKLTAGCLRKRELSARVNSAEVIEILAA